MIEIDGSLYEGGGQTIRIGVALAVILRRKTRIFKIRAGRKNPGLGNQHLGSEKSIFLFIFFLISEILE